MKVLFFSTKPYEQSLFTDVHQCYQQHINIDYTTASLTIETISLAQGYDAVCCFVYDHLNAGILTRLHQYNIRLIALRSAGYNHVDIDKAHQLGITVVRVPAYSPYAVAEHAIALILTLNRKIHRAYMRVRERDFSLQGLCGFDQHGKTVGVIGTGKIGLAFCNIIAGFGCRVLAYDLQPTANIDYVSLAELYQRADIISLHCPLTTDNYHMINSAAIAAMKANVMLINTSRGGLIDTQAIIQGLKQKKIGYLGLDVYEEEEGLFFADHSEDIIQDDIFSRLQTFPNVVITAHQGFFTQEALHNIAQTTLKNIAHFAQGDSEYNAI